MRIWDVSPGYLSGQSLLGEHRELHGLHSILTQGKRGYSRHPETLRWVGCLSGLRRRHAWLAAEMSLRGWTDRTPLPARQGAARWPTTFVTPAGDQFALLASKYAGRHAGRVPLPRNAQELWAQHKYSVMARDPAAYRSMGRRVAGMRTGSDVGVLAAELVRLLRDVPTPARLINALEHMWGHVSKVATPADRSAAERSPAALLAVIGALAVRQGESYLLASTALSDLALFAPHET